MSMRTNGSNRTNDARYHTGNPAAPVAPAKPAATLKKPRRPRISSQLEPFIADRNAGRPMRENTADAYRYHVRSFIDVLGDMPVDDTDTGQ